jgi:hypothetical protein
MLHAGPYQGADNRTDLASDAARFRAYRRELRESEWHERPDLRAWDGPLHRLMADLGQRLERGRSSARDVIRLLGEPDEVVRTGGRHVQVVVPRHETHLVYRWRGGHDYLYLVVRGGRVVRSRWWLVGE